MAVEERDPHTGYLTTGHEWNGITELNRPVPKAIWLFLLSTVIFSIVWWVLMPAWPLGDTYTRGVLGVDQRERVAKDLAAAAARRADAMAKINALSFSEIQADPALMQFVRDSGRMMFGDNCAVCHGVNGQGGPGFPDLTDQAWLWGGDPDTVAETVRVGINAGHPETRISQMMAFGRDGILDRESILNVVAYVRSLSQSAAIEVERLDPGRQVFAENCAACHGENAEGDTEMGAPNLTDHSWLYGGDVQSVFMSVYHGRQGQMPSWEGRLTEAERKILTLYALDLGNKRYARSE
jgi:cytochrome c oxidase cbb3-type subunit 3